MPEALKKGNCHNMFPLNQLGKLSNKNVVISSLNVFVGVMFLDFDSHCSGPWTEWKFGEWTFWVSKLSTPGLEASSLACYKIETHRAKSLR